MASKDASRESVAAGSLDAGVAAGSGGEGTAAGEALAGGVSPAGVAAGSGGEGSAAPKASSARGRKERRQRKAMTCVLLVI